MGILKPLNKEDGKMKTYRIWFSNGSAVLVNTNTVQEAKKYALTTHGEAGLKITRVECLDNNKS